MIFQVVCMKDLAIQSFQQPMFVQHVGMAVRSFQDEVNRVADDNPLFRHPEDFELHRLGSFDSDSGLFDCSVQELLLRAKDAVRLKS